MDLNLLCQVLVVSAGEFKGLLNLDRYADGNTNQSLPLQQLKPHPSAWMKDATKQWVRQHKASPVKNEFQAIFESSESVIQN
jgi:hypothetical protein